MAATDILTEAEAQEAINATDAAAHLTELRRAVSAVSQAIDAACGPVVAREVTEVHVGGGTRIWPHEPPVLSVTTLTEFDGTTQTALTDETPFGTVGGTTGFVIGAGWIERRSGGSAYDFAGQVQVVYQAGRFAATAEVGDRWKYAAGAILQRLWKREGSAWAYSPDFYANSDEQVAGPQFFRAVAPMIDEFLWDEKRPPAIA